jgi:hypothetical protein
MRVFMYVFVAGVVQTILAISKQQKCCLLMAAERL